MSPLAEAEPPPGTSQPGEAELCRLDPEWRQRGPGTALLPLCGAAGVMGKGGDWEHYQGSPSTHLPHPGSSRSRFPRVPPDRSPCPNLPPRAASSPFPGPACAAAGGPRPRWSSSPRALRLSTAASAWKRAAGAERTASPLRRVISCHPLPAPELWLRPGGTKRSR